MDWGTWYRMIVMGLLNVLFSVLKVLFGWLSLPDMPEVISSTVDSMLIMIIDATPMLWLFIDKELAHICLGVALACMNFDKIYDLLMWVLAKLPLGIHKN